MSVLLYSDKFAEVTLHCERILRTGGRALPRRSVQIAGLVRARARALRGHCLDAAAELQDLLDGGLPAGLRGVAVAWLLEALAGAGETQQANQLLLGDRFGPIDELPDQAHIHAARGAVQWADGRYEQSLAEYLTAGRILADLRVANSAIVAWRSRAALAAVTIGRTELALALAEDELAIARRWGAPGAVGAALRALGLARRDSHSTHVLERAVELLQLADARYELVPALCDLARLHVENAEPIRARTVLVTAIEYAVASGNRAWLEQANALLPLVSERRKSPKLTRQEQKITRLALEGLANKDIAETMFLTIRTVEFHLSNVYRKLGISGRSELRDAISPAECA
ncbi:helix-turn-helix transcriptional regulator [Nocardia stercoris]|uniref:helix-turn-helix transcriptional regulator n=1 Tax=Nocardia stercoris TaxID=2483361 RepID=UPI001319C33D|nr:LuxR family transcriptional regulator [Nocardia stercoris]